MAHVKKFEHLKIHLEAIKSATNNFAEESCIGRGGFGKVYKGEIAGVDGQPMVALKRLDPKFGQGDVEFWKEIMMLSQYKHKNIVSLLGFCDDCGEKILVYEYVPNRSLDCYLNSENIRWIQRLKICIGAAHGLAYLHNAGGSQQRVLHRDIKSSNILLTEDWNAKISDFGLSKFGPANQQYTFLISKAVGTPGYCDPLYAENGYLTKESDIYSFGVVLFEVLCGRLCIDSSNTDSLLSLVRQSYKQKTINQIVYDNIKDEINPDSLQVFVTIAYNCIKRDREERPLMGDIVRELESALRYQELSNDQIVPPKPSEVLDSDRWNFGMASSSGNSSQIQNSGSESDLSDLMDQSQSQSQSQRKRKRKRIQSNRETAQRLRMRKQKHLNDLTDQINQMKRDNTQILTTIDVTTQQLVHVEADNSVLSAQFNELRQMLDYLNEINILMSNTNNNNNST